MMMMMMMMMMKERNQIREMEVKEVTNGETL